MFERFTNRANKVIQLADQEVGRFNHKAIGTEHLLLAICKEECVAKTLLLGLGKDPAQIRLEVKKLIQPGPSMIRMGLAPINRQAQDCLDLAMAEAWRLGSAYLGTQHILFSLLRDQDSLAASVLHSFGLTLEMTRTKLSELTAYDADVIESGAPDPRCYEVDPKGWTVFG